MASSYSQRATGEENAKLNGEAESSQGSSSEGDSAPRSRRRAPHAEEAEGQRRGERPRPPPASTSRSKIGRGQLTGLALGTFASYAVSDLGVRRLRPTPEGLELQRRLIPYPKGKNLVSNEVMLVQGEGGMLLLSSSTEAERNWLKHLDLSSGQVVAEWKPTCSERPLVGIAAERKGAQVDPDQSAFVGMTTTDLRFWDLRVPGGSTQQRPTDCGHNFRDRRRQLCIATAGNGQMAVGSADGKVRMYSPTSLHRAATVFPGFGSPVTSLDVTHDGRWVLATTPAFLILLSFAGRKLVPRRVLLPLPAGAPPREDLRAGRFCDTTDEGTLGCCLSAFAGTQVFLWQFQDFGKMERHHCGKAEGREGPWGESIVDPCSCCTIFQTRERVVDAAFSLSSRDGGPSLIIATTGLVLTRPIQK